ncbi:MAG: hypothetical protein ACREFD_00015 [Stellaceae bacterium]
MMAQTQSLFGGVMIRLSLRYFYRLGQIIHPLTEFEAGQKKVVDVWEVLFPAQTELSGLFSTDNWFTRALRTSWEAGPALLAAITEVLGNQDWEAPVTFLQAYTIQNAAKEFETKFTGELHVADSYFVIQKGGLDTLRIITDATVLFPADLAAKVPLAVGDVREAGKCIAFELATAAGFHLLRAVEAVLRRYYDEVSAGKRRPKSRNIGAYLVAMQKQRVGDAKIIAVLDQIRDLHRNPLMHPEETLSLDEAIDLLGIVRSAVGSMLRKIPVPEVVLTPPASETLTAASDPNEQSS